MLYIGGTCVAGNLNGFTPDNHPAAERPGDQKSIPGIDDPPTTGAERGRNDRHARQTRQVDDTFAGPHAGPPRPIRGDTDAIAGAQGFNHGPERLGAAFGRRSRHCFDTEMTNRAGNDLSIAMLGYKHMDGSISRPAVRHHQQSPMPKTQDEGLSIPPMILGRLTADNLPSAGGMDEPNVESTQPTKETPQTFAFQELFQHAHAPAAAGYPPVA